MGFFLPSSWQRRILRYALSQLELLDTDGLDLDKLDIAFGSRSTVELRDLGLRLDKLPSVLQLPNNIVITKARLRAIRLHIPADIYRKGIVFETDGIHVEATIKSDVQREGSSPDVKERAAGLGGRTRESGSIGGWPKRTYGVLPTTTDLAQSYLDAEPEEKKEQLRASIARPQDLDESQSSDGSESYDNEGLGDGFSMPGFVAGFLTGVVDRIRGRVLDTIVDMRIALDKNSQSHFNTESGVSDIVVFRLKVDEIEVGSASASAEAPDTTSPMSSSAHATSSTTVGNRRITIKGIQGLLFSDLALFSSLAQSSGPTSPSTTYSSSERPQRKTKTSPTLSDQASSSSETGLGLTQNSFVASTHSVGLENARSEIHSSIDSPAQSEDTLSESLDASMRSVRTHNSSQTRDARGAWGSESSMQFGSAQSELFDQDSQMSESDHVPTLSLSEQQRQVERPVDIHQSEPHSQESSPRASRSDYLDALGAQYSPSKLHFELDPEVVQSGYQEDAQHVSSPDPDIFEANSSPEQSFHQAVSEHEHDLTQSRLFSHDEAKSMYESASSHAGPSLENENRIPGQWLYDDIDTERPVLDEERVSTPTPKTSSEKENFVRPEPDNEAEVGGPSFHFSGATDSRSQPTSTPSTPRVQISQPQLPEHIGIRIPRNPHPSAFSDSPVISKRLLWIDKITIDLPSAPLAAKNAVSDAEPSASSLYATHRLPGGFSSSVISSSSIYPNRKEFDHTSLSAEPQVQKMPHKATRPVAIGIQHVKVSTDMGLIRLALLASAALMTKEQQKSTVPHPTKTSRTNLSLTLDDLQWNLVSSNKGIFHDPSTSPSTPAQSYEDLDTDILLCFRLKILSVAVSENDVGLVTDLQIGKLSFGYENAPIIDFDNSLKMRESIRDVLSPVGQDVKVSIIPLRNGELDVTVMTLPLHIGLDLTRLDETFGWFGGLSGILELGSSVISTVTVTEPKPNTGTSTRSNRAVHFDGPFDTTNQRSKSSSSPKITARIGGLVIDMQGKESSLSLDGSAVKIACRNVGNKLGVRMGIDKIEFRGPGLTSYLGSVKLQYFQLPEDEDLERILALLSPSSERDETGDDILLDTFIRQRRKGGVLRLEMATAKCNVESQNELSKFTAISEDLKKLSSVTKYLPEDDRPGVLTLLHLGKVELVVPVNGSFGPLTISTDDLEIGHVSFPSLFLLGVDAVKIKRSRADLKEQVLVETETFSESSSQESNIPSTISVRLIGDELEPTLKLRLWNLRLNYHVSTVMSLLGIIETASGEVVVNELVQSVADLAKHNVSPPPLSREVSSTSNQSSSSSRSLKFDIGIRDSLVSLNPRGSPAQGLLVFTHAQVAGNFPKETQPNISGSFDVKKMSVLVIDDIANIRAKSTTDNQGIAHSSAHREDQLETLQTLGYVCVSEISSARIVVNVIAPTAEKKQCVDIEIKDDLFVLETCADSTQTLQTIMNGLTPPMPPSQDLKYRTEVVPVQDMLASFTGDSYPTDIDAEDDTDYSTQLQEDVFVDDEIPQNIEYLGDYYDQSQHSSQGSQSMTESDVSTARGSQQISAGTPLQTESSHSGHIAAESIHFNENHFASKPRSQEEIYHWNSNRNAFEDLEDIEDSRMDQSPFRLRLRDVHVIWNLFDGYDWQRTRDTISSAVAEVENRAAERQTKRDKRKSLDEEDDADSVIGDFLFNSIYIGVGINQNPRDLSRQVNRNLDDLASEAESFATTTGTAVSASPNRQGFPRSKRRRLRLQRSRQRKMTFELRGVAIDLDIMPPGSSETQSSIDIRVRDFDIYDHVPTSTWKKFATYMHDAGERESGASMAHIRVLNVKPDLELAASEIVLKADILPLRLHVDQDALDFLTRFFEFKDEATITSSSPSEQPFIQRAEVNSIPIKLDFKPKRVDYAGLRSGKTTEFMNFIVLDGADMVLRHVIIYGISGFEKLGKTLNDIWMPDVKNNQLPGVLAGLAPVRSLVNVGSGVRDLVVIPMREYRKDGRIVRSIQKGALSFAKTTTTELTKLGAKLAVGTQTILQGAEGVMSPKYEPDVQLSESPPDEKPIISPYADPPVGVIQGLRGGYRHLERDLLLARDAIVAMPGEVMESSSAGGAAKAVLKGAPTIILRPALGVSKAVGQALMGATSALDKDERRRLDEKYKRR